MGKALNHARAVAKLIRERQSVTYRGFGKPFVEPSTKALIVEDARAEAMRTKRAVERDREFAARKEMRELAAQAVAKGATVQRLDEGKAYGCHELNRKRAGRLTNPNKAAWPYAH